jgi:indole-3-glycerol phosphate synthase
MAGIPSILQKIVEHKRAEVAAAKAQSPEPVVEGLPPTRDFRAAIEPGGGTRRRRVIQEPGAIRLIAEVKRASPTRGVFLADFDPVRLGRTFDENGAAAISVLTDREFFQGDPAYLAQVRDAVQAPVFRKEFLIDPWQIAESRALGADAVLLIAALLSTSEIQEYLDRCRALSLGALVEVHDEAELERALATDAPIIGVNNRNLHTFETTLATTERLAPAIKAAGRVLVSESGIFTREDLARLAPFGVDAVLVGEALVRGGVEGAAARVRELAGWRG